MRLFVHNFRFDCTEEQLIDFFRSYGDVTRVSIVKDRDTGRSKGFGFVDVDPFAQYSDCLVETVNGATLHGRSLNIELAREKGRSNGGGHAPAPERKHNNGKKGKKSGGRRERYNNDESDWKD